MQMRMSVAWAIDPVSESRPSSIMCLLYKRCTKDAMQWLKNGTFLYFI
jgi:hypothetical protein